MRKFFAHSSGQLIFNFFRCSLTLAQAKRLKDDFQQYSLKLTSMNRNKFQLNQRKISENIIFIYIRSDRRIFSMIDDFILSQML